MIGDDDQGALPGARVVDRDGEEIGRVDRVFVSDDDGRPVFVLVRGDSDGSGPSDRHGAIVPLHHARLQQGDLHVAYPARTVRGAPTVDADGALSDDEQGTVFDYYDGHAGGVPSGEDVAPAGLGDAATGTDDEADADGAGRTV